MWSLNFYKRKFLSLFVAYFPYFDLSICRNFVVNLLIFLSLGAAILTVQHTGMRRPIIVHMTTKAKGEKSWSKVTQLSRHQNCRRYNVNIIILLSFSCMRISFYKLNDEIYFTVCYYANNLAHLVVYRNGFIIETVTRGVFIFVAWKLEMGESCLVYFAMPCRRRVVSNLFCNALSQASRV